MVSNTLLKQTDAVIYARCGSVWVMVLTAPPKTADMEAAEGALAEMKRLMPAGFPTLTWVTTAAGFSMEKEARVAASVVTRRYNDVITAQATVIEAGGFPGAAVRMIIAGLDLLSGTKAPTKVFATIADAVPWCLAHGGAGERAADVAAAVEALRARA